MNTDFNLHDLIYFKTQPGKVVGLLEGGEYVILKVGEENFTVPNGHPELLTLKQKKHRDEIKEKNAKANAAILAEVKAPIPAPVVINNVDSKPKE